MYRCEACDSTEVDQLQWVDMNTQEIVVAAYDDTYCNNCAAECAVYWKEEDEEH